MTRLGALTLLFTLSVCLPATNAFAQPTIFLVRHAERATISGRVPSDTGLSATGKARAKDLAQALADAKITAIYTTEYQRTRETAIPLGESFGIRPEVVAADDLRALIAKLRSARGNVLVIGHSNTLPQIINALGVTTRVTIAESDYDNLFLVVPERERRLIHLHYR
jgi:broad specificity phosphatase PhoE